jgi:hypothetical protein
MTMTIHCPQCQSIKVITKDDGRNVGGIVGAVGGAASGIASALGGAEIGGTMGLIAGPPGAVLGTVAGAIIGALVGMATGGVTGAKLGQLTEERNLLLRALGVKKAAAYLCPMGALPRDNCEVRMDKATKRPIFNPFDVPFYTLQGTSGRFPERLLWLASA